MLNFGSVDRHTIVNDGNMIAMSSNMVSGMSGACSGMCSKVFSLGMLHFGGVMRSTMTMAQGSQDLGMSGEVFGLCGLHIGIVYGHSCMSQGDMSLMMTAIGPRSSIQRALVQVVMSVIVSSMSCSCMSGSMFSLGVLYFGGINWNATMSQSNMMNRTVRIMSRVVIMVGMCGIGMACSIVGGR